MKRHIARGHSSLNFAFDSNLSWNIHNLRFVMMGIIQPHRRLICDIVHWDDIVFETRLNQIIWLRNDGLIYRLAHLLNGISVRRRCKQERGHRRLWIVKLDEVLPGHVSVCKHCATCHVLCTCISLQGSIPFTFKVICFCNMNEYIISLALTKKKTSELDVMSCRVNLTSLTEEMCITLSSMPHVPILCCAFVCSPQKEMTSRMCHWGYGGGKLICLSTCRTKTSVHRRKKKHAVEILNEMHS